MKVYSGTWVSYLMVGTALMFLTVSSSTASSSIDDVGVTVPATSRKLKENGYNLSTDKKRNHMDLDDYYPVDPVPSSKASIRPGPIQHGSPLNPYIPKPSPPSPGHPKIGGLA